MGTFDIKVREGGGEKEQRFSVSGQLLQSHTRKRLPGRSCLTQQCWLAEESPCLFREQSLLMAKGPGSPSPIGFPRSPYFEIVAVFGMARH